MRLRISRSALAGIRAEAASAHPREACGLLFGGADRIVQTSVTANVAEFPERRFEIDPAALFVALKAERTGGPMVAGYWHSHPSGNAMPSLCDAEVAAPDGKLWLVVAGGDVTGWRAGETGLHGRFEPVVLDVEGA